MKIGPLFWVLMILAVLGAFGAFWWPDVSAVRFGSTLLGFVLFGLLGWQVFGAAIQR